MLVIREEQWDVFVRASLESLRERVLAKARADWRSEAEEMGVDAFDSRIRGAVRRAVEYGLSTDRAASEFVDLTFVWSDDFDVSAATPWAGPILQAEMDGDAKLTALLRRSELALEERISGRTRRA
ncbi:hypothetical protein RAS1_26620 [Phycisphaerae bacterium RAS1]|nr:hypothetical protein RAS1_26620 [Phycisphaerae bacterium RAS1]